MHIHIRQNGISWNARILTAAFHLFNTQPIRSCKGSLHILKVLWHCRMWCPDIIKCECIQNTKELTDFWKEFLHIKLLVYVIVIKNESKTFSISLSEKVELVGCADNEAKGNYCIGKFSYYQYN